MSGSRVQRGRHERPLPWSFDRDANRARVAEIVRNTYRGRHETA